MFSVHVLAMKWIGDSVFFNLTFGLLSNISCQLSTTLCTFDCNSAVERFAQEVTHHLFTQSAHNVNKGHIWCRRFPQQTALASVCLSMPVRLIVLQPVP